MVAMRLRPPTIASTGGPPIEPRRLLNYRAIGGGNKTYRPETTFLSASSPCNPMSRPRGATCKDGRDRVAAGRRVRETPWRKPSFHGQALVRPVDRSEERRVGKERRSR